jgi:hypothetical protein
VRRKQRRKNRPRKRRSRSSLAIPMSHCLLEDLRGSVFFIITIQYCISSDSSTHTAVTRKQSAESSKSTTLEAPAPSARTRTTSDSRRNSDMEFPQHLSRIRSPVPDKNVSISLLDKPRRCSKMASQLIERIRMESKNTGASLRTDLPQARSM